MTRHFNTIRLISLLFLFIWQEAFSVEENGMLFHSHEVRPDKRTSLCLPAETSSGIGFSKSFDLSFEVRIDNDKERFGYICRVVIDGEESIDVLLSTPYSGLPFIGVTAGKTDFKPVKLDGSIGDWNEILVCIKEVESTFVVSVNGETLCMLQKTAGAHSASVFWGTVPSGKFSTSDAAPMSLRNLAMKTDGHRGKFWPLSSESDLVSDRQIALSAINPVWLADLCRSWHPVRSFTENSKTFIAVDRLNEYIHIISKEHIIRYDLASGKATEWKTSSDALTLDLCTGDFYVLPNGGGLCYVDFLPEPPLFSEFDMAEGKWTVTCPKTKVSRWLHSNTFYNEVDSSLVQMFGYGYHKYYNELNVLHPSSGTFVKTKVDVPPRYLAATGIYDGKLYVYGGKGNDNGSQELGVKTYSDLIVMDLKTYETKRLWSLPEDCCVAASDLEFSEDGKWFYALTFNPNIFPSELQLRKFSVEDGSSEVFANPIRYDFIDVDSDAGLVASKSEDAFFAYMVTKNEAGKYVVNIYRVNNPVAPCEVQCSDETESESGEWILWLMVAAFAVVAVILVLYGRHGDRKFVKEKTVTKEYPEGQDSQVKDETTETEAVIQEEPLSAGVYLLGGFKVINRDHQDISGNFTPLMKQLLSLIVLYTERYGGISNVELKEILWEDKSNESFSNNRGVNFKKIRTCLSEVGGIDMVSSHGKWCIADDEGLCDWLVEKKLINSLDTSSLSEARMEEVLRLAKKGPLLPEMRFDWLDPFKAKYTESILNLLSGFRDAENVSPQMQIRISDLILEFDSLDEDSICVKCKAYIRMKRLGSAQKVYKNFTDEYRAVMGEDFSVSFKEFIKED